MNTKNVLLSTKGRTSWLVYISTLKSIVLLISGNYLLTDNKIYNMHDIAAAEHTFSPILQLSSLLFLKHDIAFSENSFAPIWYLSLPMFLILDVAVSEFSFDPVWQLYSLVSQVQQLFFLEEAALLALYLSI